MLKIITRKNVNEAADNKLVELLSRVKGKSDCGFKQYGLFLLISLFILVHQTGQVLSHTGPHVNKADLRHVT